MNYTRTRLTENGLDAVVAAPHADRVDLCLFDGDGEVRLPMDPDGAGRHRLFVAGIGPGRQYGFRTHGPWAPAQGLLHDPSHLLSDPAALALTGAYRAHPAVGHDVRGIDTAPFVPRSVTVDPPAPPRPGPGTAWDNTVIYETHVRGLTMQHPDVDPRLRGTYLGAASEPVIEHLERLGVTTVELMPVAHHITEPFLQAQGRTNYWGYSTLAWFAPHGGYATADDGRQVWEFAAMIDRFHAAGLEVIVDVVFNHTAEGSEVGPILSLKGFDNEGWYRLDHEARYVDWTGTGNTVNTASPVVRATILEALRWWAEGLGVDGFRFDLGVVLGRNTTGKFQREDLAWLTADPVVGARKLIAEPWDLGPDGYQLGNFGAPWREWNGRFRDDVRDYWRGAGSTAGLIRRLEGSEELFPTRNGVNFVTAHDGFTLADLVSYDRKHNEANGELNSDGHGDNRSWNSGVEGPSDDPEVLENRRLRAAAMLSTLLLSAGTPMLLGGDELGRTQRGNNNAYSIDGPLTWFDWTELPWVEMVGRLAALRPKIVGSPRPIWTTLDGASWPAEGLAPVRGLRGGIVLTFNPTAQEHTVALPEGKWGLAVDSAGPVPMGDAELYESDAPVPAWSVRVFTR